MPELFERGRVGERLAPEARLAGMDAVRFVTELLPALEAIDGVVVEHVGALPEYREADAAPVVSLGGQESSDNDWFDLSVTVTVGGEQVPFAELFVALAEGLDHLILPSGTYFSLDVDELQELARLIAEARALLDDVERRHPAQPVPGQPVGGPPAARGGHRPGPGVGGVGAGPVRGRRADRVPGARPACRPPCGPISSPGSTGWPTSTSTDWAGSWPTTWGWARRSRPWPSCATPRSGV